jgi:hypothetical protein
MKFGMNLLLWTGELNDQMLPVLEMLKRVGFAGIEVPLFNYDLDYSAWGKRLDDLGLGRTAVTIRGAGDNPISSDAAVRQKGVEGNWKAIDCCQAMGATHLVGPFHSALGDFSGAGPTADVAGVVDAAPDATAVKGIVSGGVQALSRQSCRLTLPRTLVALPSGLAASGPFARLGPTGVTQAADVQQDVLVFGLAGVVGDDEAVSLARIEPFYPPDDTDRVQCVQLLVVRHVQPPARIHREQIMFNTVL